MSNELVLVTGGTGFVGTHCILQLLQAGYRVRTTVRTLNREGDVRAMLKVGGSDPGDRLTFAKADLLSDEGWAEAVSGCEYVLHIASPFPAGPPKHEDELIVPAREGALRVLRSSREAGVKRVVLTSSFAAIGYSPKSTGGPYTEEDFTNPNAGNLSAYVKSKTLAEASAWEFMRREGGALELAVVNPTGIFGPVLGPDFSSSIQMVKNLLTGSMSAMPQLSFGVVDVRDVASLHLLAMTNPQAKGQRFLAVDGPPMSLPQIAALLKTQLGPAADRVPTRVLPNWLVRLVSFFKPELKDAVPLLGKTKPTSNEKAKRLLGWEPRSNQEAILATAESLLRLGLLEDSNESNKKYAESSR